MGIESCFFALFHLTPSFDVTMIHILLPYKLIASSVKSAGLAPYFQVSYQTTSKSVPASGIFVLRINEIEIHSRFTIVENEDFTILQIILKTDCSQTFVLYVEWLFKSLASFKWLVAFVS